MRFRYIAPLAALSLAGCATVNTGEPVYEPGGSAAGSAASMEGAVSAADPRAQAAGEAMLGKGGTATDAAIAVMLALTVVEPQSSGIGGGGFLVRGTADGSVTTYDGRETAPAAATPDWFLGEDGSLPDFRTSVASGLSVGVPGNIALAAKAHAEHGVLPWADLFEPAIELARDGFVVNPRFRNSVSSMRDFLQRSPLARSLYFDAAGEPLPVGTTIRNPQLAATLSRIANEGREAFYSGALPEEIAATVAADTPKAGTMTAEDFAGYQAKTREGVCLDYREHRVCAMGPPTSGGIAVLQMLGMLERYDLAALGARNPETWHLFLEAQRLAYADRELYLADSDYVSVPVEGLLDKTYLAQRSALISPDASIAQVVAGRPAGAQARADGDEPEERGTSHIAIVDRDGTMISYTSTIESAFGSGLTVGGFFLNNELTDFSRAPSVNGMLVANRVEAGKRPRSSMAPTVVYAPDGAPLLSVGAAGGSTIPVQTARSIVGIVDFGLSAREALGLPFVMAFGNNVLLEQGTWLEDAANAFRALGHTEISIREAPVKGGAVLRTPDGWQSARDPRLDGMLDLP
ncbi:gamma-glutamyltransferase [Erythrobacter litoralis]|uniref:gamma-glutamyltransferase n=1 Tax=Erythrobacter litoralis TaxID=39960 RepID=UPI002434F831|nr:gamma-glutamyltransferase [Erythrobacter litoralis]MDG6079454.1 gamma-glutamyltransferase [Erythrobacter litoralis]